MLDNGKCGGTSQSTLYGVKPDERDKDAAAHKLEFLFDQTRDSRGALDLQVLLVPCKRFCCSHDCTESCCVLRYY